MNKVYSLVEDRFVNPLFEVFDGGDFVLSSYRDVEGSSTEMQVYFPDDGDKDAAIEALRSAIEVVGARADVEYASIPDEDWLLSYRRHFKTDRIGKGLLVVPEWEADSFQREQGDEKRQMIVLDPGLAFGTGKHETTRACLEYIDELSASGGTFLDMGCGSGILSIAAAKLGYQNVAGFDIDSEAVASALENVALNKVCVDLREFALGGGALTLDSSIEAAKGIYPDLALQNGSQAAKCEYFAPADVVVANILGPLLIAFAEEIVGYVRKNLVISGILNELYPEVLDAFKAHGFSEVSRKSYGEWSTGLLIRQA
ncbi:MAG: 50S ribosomal protein L11 methyltransferase [Kiritimatiellae bacterium]|nr:50S ribosomal protein L11 methyltransferase [Kiritimatiellia bacterium]